MTKLEEFLNKLTCELPPASFWAGVLIAKEIIRKQAEFIKKNKLLLRSRFAKHQKEIEEMLK